MSNIDAVRAIGKKGTTEPAAQGEELVLGQLIRADEPVRTSSTKEGSRERDELMEMCAEVSLLELVREDTNELGHQRGGYVAFDHCPVCGHRDCFRAYENNSWACFGASNTARDPNNKAAGGNVLDYLEQARHMGTTEAVAWLREKTGHPYKPLHNGDAKAEPAPKDGDKLLLPPWDAVRAADPPKRSPVLIDGILRRGHVALLSGKGKGSKTWSAIECAVAVAVGGRWFGFKCESGRCLFIDPELDRASLDVRFAKVCEALGADASLVDARVSKWCLRGVADASMKSIVHDLGLRGEAARFDLVIIDSASCFVEGDENSSVDLRRFSASVLLLASVTGASVLLIHHMGKGNAGDRDSIERARGSSVWGDFPDAPLSLTEVFPKEGEPGDYLADGERAFILEDGGLREFPSIKPRRLIFGYPVHRIDTKGITADWMPRTTKGRSRGGKSTAELNKAKKQAEQLRIVSELLGWFYSEGVGSDGLILKECAEHVGEDSRKVRAAVEASAQLRIFRPSPRKAYVVPAHPPVEDPDPTLFEDGSD